MRYQSKVLVARDTVARLTAVLTQSVAVAAAVTLVAGWSNFGIVALYGYEARFAFLDLSDTQFSVLNFLEPCALVVASALCAVLTRVAPSTQRRPLIFLSIGFIALTAGELGFANSHSTYIEYYASTFGTHGPAAPILPLFVVPAASALYLTGFLRRLPERFALGFVLSGCVYVTGVLGFEIISEVLGAKYGGASVRYLAAAGIEETLEILGVVGFLLTASGYMRALSPKVHRGSLGTRLPRDA